VLIGLHNHYVDIKHIHTALLAAGAAGILTPVNLPELAPKARTRPGYWLDRDFVCRRVRTRGMILGPQTS
jgi:hypothetical protein